LFVYHWFKVSKGNVEFRTNIVIKKVGKNIPKTKMRIHDKKKKKRIKKKKQIRRYNKSL